MKNQANKLLTAAFALTVVFGACSQPFSPARAASGDQTHKQTQSVGRIGLACAVGKSGYPTAENVRAGSPAAKAGLAGQTLYAINGEDTRYMGYMHLYALLAGAPGTSVELKVGGSNPNKTRTLRLTRVPVANIDELRTFELGKWKVLKAPDHNNHFADRVIDLPFALLSQLKNKPTLFEFVEDKNAPGIEEKLKKHADAAHIMERCRIVRLSKEDPSYTALTHALGLSGPYNLLPVYAPWLVTAKKIDLVSAEPSDKQVDHIARILVHGAVRVQVAKSAAASGLSHVSVWKRVYEVVPAGSGVAGVGFGAAADGHPNITRIFKGGAADKVGLNPGDEITEINGEDTRFLGLERLQTELVGEAGKIVKLKVRPASHEGTSAGKPEEIRKETPEETKNVELKLEPIEGGEFNNLSIAVWKKIESQDPFDTDEFELPCCMIGRANARPTIFEFAEHDGPSVEKVLDGLKQWHIDDASVRVHDLHDLQVVRYTPADKDWGKLHELLQIKTSYVALPVYLRTRHKTYKRGQLLTGPPTTVEQGLPLIAP